MLTFCITIGKMCIEAILRTSSDFWLINAGVAQLTINIFSFILLLLLGLFGDCTPVLAFCSC